MGDKFLKKKKLKIPKYLTDEDIILPVPKPWKYLITHQ
jgi:hypothetical protein